MMASSINEMGDCYCSIIPLPHKEDADDQPYARDMFSLEISVSTMKIPKHVAEADSLDSEDESWIFEADHEVEEAAFLVERRRLEEDDASGPTVEGFLDALRVPRRHQGVVVATIVGCARELARQEGFLGSKLLRLGVSIHLPPCLSSDEDDEDSALTYEDDR